MSDTKNQKETDTIIEYMQLIREIYIEINAHLAEHRFEFEKCDKSRKILSYMSSFIIFLSGILLIFIGNLFIFDIMIFISFIIFLLVCIYSKRSYGHLAAIVELLPLSTMCEIIFDLTKQNLSLDLLDAYRFLLKNSIELIKSKCIKLNNQVRLKNRLYEISQHCSSIPDLDIRSPEEILGNHRDF